MHDLSFFRTNFERVAERLASRGPIAGLDRLPNRRPDTVYTWICAKLLLVQIARKMASSKMAIPPSGLCS